MVVRNTVKNAKRFKLRDVPGLVCFNGLRQAVQMAATFEKNFEKEYKVLEMWFDVDQVAAFHVARLPRQNFRCFHHCNSSETLKTFKARKLKTPKTEPGHMRAELRHCLEGARTLRLLVVPDV